MLPDFADSEAQNRFFERIKELSLSKDKILYAIKLSGKVIGIINEVEKTEDEIELGYALVNEEWGKGYMTEVLSAAINLLIEGGFQRVLTGAFLQNAASMRVMEKCGMKKIEKVDIIEYRGENHKCVYYVFEK